MEKAVLVTGGAGYIGSHTAYLMAQKGYRPIIIDTLLHSENNKFSNLQFFKADFADEKTLDHIFTNYKIDAVFHFAAHIEVGESVKNPLRFYDNNVVKTIKLLEKMLQHGVKKMIFSSSCAVYGNPQNVPIAESHPRNPVSPYGKNKLAVEMILEDFSAAYGLQYVALRYFNAAGAMPEYGLGELHEPETHVVPLVLRAARKKTPFYIFGNDYATKDGTCIRDFIHVWDLADAHYLAYKHLCHGNPSDYFNLGSGRGFSVKQMIDKVESVCNTKVKTVVSKRRAGDPPILLADPSKAHNILQWQPQYSDLDFIIKSADMFESSLI